MRPVTKADLKPEMFTVLKQIPVDSEFVNKLENGKCWRLYGNTFAYVIQDEEGFWKFEMTLPTREQVVENPHLDHRIEFANSYNVKDIPTEFFESPGCVKAGVNLRPYAVLKNISAVIAEKVKAAKVKSEQWVKVTE